MFNIIKSTDHSSKLAIFAALSLFIASLAQAQTPAPLESGGAADPEWTALTTGELEELLGPIALYPDDLIAIVLPASTFPLQIVQASRYLEERTDNAALQPDESWDDSVIALLNYPEVLALLNEDLDWTYALGEAVVYQQGDVLNAIQSFRDRAYASGNLATDERQVVAAQDDGAITISPADPAVIYVPYYDPTRVVVRSRVPSYYYYPAAYPVYYYPYPAGYSFGSGFFWGVTTAFLVSWPDHYLHVRHHHSFGHPYYGYNYYTPWYARTNVYVNVNNFGNYNRWRPSYRHGARPAHPASYARLGNRPVVRTPTERRIRSGWVPNQRDNGDFRDQRRTVTNGSLDDSRTRRIRSGRDDANDIRTRSDAGGARQGRSAATGGAARTRSDRQPSVADNYRRPRGTTEATPANTDSRIAQSRFGRVQARGDGRPSPSQAERLADRGRVQARDSNTIGRVRVAPQRGAQTNSPATRTPQRGSTPTFGRIAPAQRAPDSGRSGMRREQPMSPPNVQRRGPSPNALLGRANTARAPVARQNGGARAQPRGSAQLNGRPGGVQQHRRSR